MKKRGNNPAEGILKQSESFELTKRDKTLLARLGNFFQACSTHGGKYVFMNGPIPEDIYKRNMLASQKISGEEERLNKAQGYNDPTIWN